MRQPGVYFCDNSAIVIAALVSLVHKHGNARQKVRVTLMQVYHLALHNNIRESRDLLLKTQMSQVITMQPVDNQILYNRALVQIGLA